MLPVRPATLPFLYLNANAPQNGFLSITRHVPGIVGRGSMGLESAMGLFIPHDESRTQQKKTQRAQANLVSRIGCFILLS